MRISKEEKMRYSSRVMACNSYFLKCPKSALLNIIRGAKPLILPGMPIPGNVCTQISGGKRLFELLNTMKDQGSSENRNRYVGGPVFADSSHGPCNWLSMAYSIYSIPPLKLKF